MFLQPFRLSRFDYRPPAVSSWTKKKKTPILLEIDLRFMSATLTVVNKIIRRQRITGGNQAVDNNKCRENRAKTHTPAQPSIQYLTGLRATAYPHTPVHMRDLSTLGLVMVIQGPLSPLLSFWLCLFVTAAYVSWCSLCHGYGITASLEILVLVLLMQDFHTCFLSPF